MIYILNHAHVYMQQSLPKGVLFATPPNSPQHRHHILAAFLLEIYLSPGMVKLKAKMFATHKTHMVTT